MQCHKALLLLSTACAEALARLAECAARVANRAATFGSTNTTRAFRMLHMSPERISASVAVEYADAIRACVIRFMVCPPLVFPGHSVYTAVHQF